MLIPIPDMEDRLWEFGFTHRLLRPGMAVAVPRHTPIVAVAVILAAIVAGTLQPVTLEPAHRLLEHLIRFACRPMAQDSRGLQRGPTTLPAIRWHNHGIFSIRMSHFAMSGRVEVEGKR